MSGDPGFFEAAKKVGWAIVAPIRWWYGLKNRAFEGGYRFSAGGDASPEEIARAKDLARALGVVSLSPGDELKRVVGMASQDGPGLKDVVEAGKALWDYAGAASG